MRFGGWRSWAIEIKNKALANIEFGINKSIGKEEMRYLLVSRIYAFENGKSYFHLQLLLTTLAGIPAISEFSG